MAIPWISTVLTLALAWAGPPPAGQGEARLKAMNDVVSRISVRLTARGTEEPATRIPDPIYRWDDPARGFGAGGVWAWTRSEGRPVALLTTCLNGPVANREWLSEFTSVTESPLSAIAPGYVVWATDSPGLSFKPIPKAPRPAADPAGRLLQMKELARRFHAHEFDRPQNGEPIRYELRLLPHPLHRYSEAATGVVDGGLFLIAYGRNPEIVLAIEARKTKSDEPVWFYAVNRIAAAELHLRLDGTEVWTHQSDFGGRTQPYTIFGIPAPGVD